MTYDVGGVELERPFRPIRLGHVGLNVDDASGALPFYRDLLGFHIADTIDFAVSMPPQVLPREVVAELPETTGFFMRYGSDHHSFVLFPRCVMSRVGNAPPEVTINQLTWQVGSLQQIVEAYDWLEAQGVRLTRSGRDMPGSNWNVYFLDPDGHINELYYGMEQIGWDGLSKPTAMHDRIFREPPSLPQPSEAQEVATAAANGVDLDSGTRLEEHRPFDHDVEGVMLPRPFKIVRLGPIGLFVSDVDASTDFYRDILGFQVTEDTEVEGHRSRFLRLNTEHHSLGLIPRGLRDGLELSPASTTAWVGVQVASYRQLRAAIDFLRSEGVTVREVTSEVLPGIDYAAWAFDPSGHAFLLYFDMEQVGSDGTLPDPAGRPARDLPWPERLPARPHYFTGEPFFGPLG